MRFIQCDVQDFNPNSEIRNPKSRNGITLAEVLIAMFVLAIGMMGVLALFPLGAVQMAQAVKDERTAQLANIMDGHARIMWRAAWLSNTGALNSDTIAFANEPGLMALDDPTNAPLISPAQTIAVRNTLINNFISGAGGSTYSTTSVSDGLSSPVYFDPIGYDTASTVFNKRWVGGTQSLPRRSINLVEQANQISASSGTLARIRRFGLADDITFTTQGVSGSPVNRGSRYNAAIVLQRQKNNVRHEANMKIVVYQGRAPADTPPTETFLTTANVTTGQDTVVIPAGIPLRKGTWILLMGQAGVNGATEAFADFYRVVGTANGALGFTLSVSPPIRSHSITGSYNANVAVLENVVEVFDRGTLSPFSVPGQ